MPIAHADEVGAVLDERDAPVTFAFYTLASVMSKLGRDNHWNRNERYARIFEDTSLDSYTLPLLQASCREKHRA